MKQAALLTIPLFFAFSYFHDYHFSLPNLSFSPPAAHASVSSSSEQENSQNNQDPNNTTTGNAAAQDKNTADFSYDWQAHRNASAPATTTSNVSDSSAPTNPSPTLPGASPVAPIPGLPNTGVQSPPTNPVPVIPADSSPPNTTVPPPAPQPTPLGALGLTIFPQSSPPPSPFTPVLTTINQTGANNLMDNSSTSSGTSVVTANSQNPPASSSTQTENSPAATQSDSGASTTSGDIAGNATTVPPPPADTNTSNTSSSTQANTPVPPPAPQPVSRIFDTGGVSFRFDDGWQSQYDVALPALQAAGIEGTFYIVTQQLLDEGFSGFMSQAEVKQLAAAGEEVGAHTQTHPHLPTLSADQQKKEIDASKSDLQAWGLNALTFSYPYGEYTANTVQMVKDAGFTSAVTTVETPVSSASDRFQIESPSIQLSNTPSQIEQMIEDALAKHQWLIMTFHRIDTSADQYSITPQNFQAVVDYVRAHHIPTVTVSEGAAALAQ